MGINKMAFNIFTSAELKPYQTEWQEVTKREFNSDEINSIYSASVMPSKYGKSVCFFLNDKKTKFFIPVEPSADVCIGDILDMKDLELVHLKYVGDKPEEQKSLEINRIRVKDSTNKVLDFNNPFGI